jgi:ABC-type amino acid transport substrate-binding protein
MIAYWKACIRLTAQGAPDACEVVNSAPRGIKLAVANNEPWMIMKNGKVSGIDLDIVNEIAARLGVEVKTVECNWTDFETQLLQLREAFPILRRIDINKLVRINIDA